MNNDLLVSGATPGSPRGAASELAPEDRRWNEWLAANAESEVRDAASRIRMIKVAAMVVIAVTTALWDYAAPYDVAIRFAISIAALASIQSAFRARSYGAALMFCAVLLVYNPLISTFQTADGWPLAVPFLALAVFGVSLTSHNRRAEKPGPSAVTSSKSIAAWENEGGAVPASDSSPSQDEGGARS